MAKKQILLLNDRLVGGGAEQIMQRIAADLAAQGAALTVYAPEGTKTLRPEIHHIENAF